jgi:hypothetical protein
VQFVRGWTTTGPQRLDTSPTNFVGYSGYDTRHLQADLDRFTFVLGADDGETLFDHEQRRQQPGRASYGPEAARSSPPT